MSEQKLYSIKPATYADIDFIIKIGRDSFLTDRQTQLKRLGNVPYLQEEFARTGAIHTLENPKMNFIKAAWNDTGEVVGSLSFFYHEFDPKDIPKLDIGDVNSISPKNGSSEQGDNEKAQTTSEPIDEKKKKANEIVDSLDEMESADMKRWQDILMPPGIKCIVLTGCSVAPEYQGQGIGSSLLKWAADQADKHNVHMWVHSSEAAWRAYAKAGFEVVGTLDVNLDEYSPGPPPEGEGTLWGHYIIRYMKRPSEA
jgi:GNAT superfamily N-acetyltransferase